MHSYYPYDGFDWTELCFALNVCPNSDGEDDSMHLKCYLESVVKSSVFKKKRYVLRRTAFEIRQYLKELANTEYDYLSQLWGGMAEIKDDETLVKVFTVNRRMAWT